MSKKILYSLFLCLTFACGLKAQDLINDVGLRLSVSAEKKLSSRFTVTAKVLARQVENVTLLNRVYVRGGLKAKLSKNFMAEMRLYYMPTRKGYQEMRNNFRYAFALVYKAKLSRRLSFSDRVTYQTTTNYLISSPLQDEKLSGVIRNRYTFSYKLNRRSEPYIKEELLWQVAGKKERYFGRNRVYLGYEYLLTDKISLDAYFIYERGFNDNDGPQEQNFFYGVNLGFSF
jgi:hypothetical protein